MHRGTKKPVTILFNNSIAIWDGQKHKARQGKGSFGKICSYEIFFLTGGS